MQEKRRTNNHPKTNTVSTPAPHPKDRLLYMFAGREGMLSGLKWHFHHPVGASRVRWCWQYRSFMDASTQRTSTHRDDRNRGNRKGRQDHSASKTPRGASRASGSGGSAQTYAQESAAKPDPVVKSRKMVKIRSFHQPLSTRKRSLRRHRSVYHRLCKA